jgi:hypothetical protein
MPESQPLPFDPLAVENVGVTLAVELLSMPLQPLPPEERFMGAGVYALYYLGDHEAYADLKAIGEAAPGGGVPLYIGSAVRENAKQGFNPKPSGQARIYNRLRNHAESIEQTDNLDLADFRCRYLVLNDAYITLAESVMITTFRPPWNGMGFGSKVVGKNRTGGRASLWDSLHTGRIGRPAGTEEIAVEARAKIASTIEQLRQPSDDERTRQMTDKIRRFLEGSS